MKSFIIAEAGVNHNGNEKLAIKLIDIAAKAGANAVKFQTFVAEKLATPFAPKAKYQMKTTSKSESQFQMLKKLELSKSTYIKLKQRCKKKKIEFLSTAFDEESLIFLVKELKVKKLKISSGDITNGPLLLAHARTGLDIILSTGMSNTSEIEKALKLISVGYYNYFKKKNIDLSSSKSIDKIYKNKEIKKLLKKKITILHCITEYPAPINDLNLKAITYLKNRFKLNLGYSDHSSDLIAPCIAVALGAKIIEKHFTINKLMRGPDHIASLNPKELSLMIKNIRNVEIMLGSENKKVMPSEKKNLNIGRKSLIASSKIMKGDRFSKNNIIIKRPGDGVSPMEYWKYLKKISNYHFRENNKIK